MTRSLLMLALLSVSTFAQAGQFTLSPSTIGVDNGQETLEIRLSYLPSAGVTDAEVQLRLNLDQLGWTQAQAIPSGTPAYETYCAVSHGEMTVLVASRNFAALPTAAPIPLCSLRVRPHASAVRGFHSITPANAYAYTINGEYVPATANSVRIVNR